MLGSHFSEWVLPVMLKLPLQTTIVSGKSINRKVLWKTRQNPFGSVQFGQDRQESKAASTGRQPKPLLYYVGSKNRWPFITWTIFITFGWIINPNGAWVVQQTQIITKAGSPRNLEETGKHVPVKTNNRILLNIPLLNLPTEWALFPGQPA